MANEVESFVKRRALRNARSALGLLRLRAPETPAVRLDTLNLALPEDRRVEDRAGALAIRESLDDRRDQVEETDRFRKTIGTIRDATGLEYQTLPSLLEYVANEPRAVINPTLDVFLYDPDHSNGFGVSRQKLRDVERRLVASVRDDLFHTEESVELLAEYHGTYGEGLGIPPCEREWFAECYRDIVTTGLARMRSTSPGGGESHDFAAGLIGKSPEHRAARAAMDGAVWDVLVYHVLAPNGDGLSELVADPPETFYSRPTTGFYPHSLHCRRAIDLGKRVEGAITATDVRDIYRIELVYNNLKGMLVEYERYEKGFDLETGRYFGSLDERFEESDGIRRRLGELSDLDEGHRVFDHLVDRYHQ